MSNSATNLVNIPDIKRVIKMNGFMGTLAAKSIMSLMGLNRVNKHYRDIRSFYGKEFTRAVMESYGITADIIPEELANIPKSGPFIIVSNHPFGGWDGIVLYDTIASVRPDFKIITNFILSHIPNLKEYFLSVNPFSGNKGMKSSIGGIKNARTILDEGGCIGIFPAGEVSTYYKGVGYCADKDWKQAIMKIVLNAKVPVIPVYFDGENSGWFHFVGKIHPMLRTVSLPAELNRREGKCVTMRIGKPIGKSEIESFKDIGTLSTYLRNRTYALEGNIAAKYPPRSVLKNEMPLPGEPDYSILSSEIEGVKRGGGFLFEVSKYECLLADHEEIPALMHEIGRKREESFREVGEGTGNSIDTDSFDKYYKHLVLWDKEASRLVGAYRLGIGREIFEKQGIEGFYTHTLFRYSDDVIKALPDTIELGRSFLSVEYKKESLPLMLLIKGLLYTVTRYNDCRYLFGPASISSWYPPFYRSLIVYALSDYKDIDMPDAIMPRTPYKYEFLRTDPKVLFAGKKENIDFLDKYIQRLSNGMFRIPTLIKKYIKLNAKIMAFNVDKEFNYCVDGLIFLDLDNVPVSEITSLTKGSDNPEELLRRFTAN